MAKDEAFKTDYASIISQMKDENEQLRLKRRWLLRCEPQNLTPRPGNTTEFIPESFLREDDLFYETVKSRVDEAFGCYKNERVWSAEESKLCPKDVVRKLDMSLDSLTNKGLYLIAKTLTGGSRMFEKTRCKMKKIIRESISRGFKDDEAEICEQMHQVLGDRGHFRKDCTITPSFQSQRVAAMKVLNELDKLSTQTLLAMKRKLNGSRKVPRLKTSKCGQSRSQLIYQIRQTYQKMLSQENGDKLHEPLAKAMSLVDLSYRLSPGYKTTATEDFFRVSPETKKLQNKIVKAFWLLGKVRFPKLKKLRLLLDPEAEISIDSLRPAVRKMLNEYLFECSDMDTIPNSLLKALSLVNRSKRNVDHKVFPGEAIKEETECILNVSAQVKQIFRQCIPDHELEQDSDDAYMEELEDSEDDDENCAFFDNEFKDTEDDAIEEGGAECDPTASTDATNQHRFGSSVVIRDLTESHTTTSLSVTPAPNKSTLVSDNHQGELKNKNQYLALQEISDETALVAHNLIGRLLEKFADQKHLHLEEDERSYLKGKSMSEENIQVSEEKKASIMVSVVKELMPSLGKRSVLKKSKELMEVS